MLTECDNVFGSQPKDGDRASTTSTRKTVQDPHAVPRALTTITNVLMEEQQVGSPRDALRNVFGLTFNVAECGRSGDNVMLPFSSARALRRLRAAQILLRCA